MEAALFQQVFDALNDHDRKLNLPLENTCPLTKVVWSSFDYTAGPELKFVWHANYHTRSRSASPAGASGDEYPGGSGTESTNTIDESSSTAHYEDIDDVFATGLLNAEIAEDDLLMRELDLRWDASIMEESAYSSDVATDSTLTESTALQS
ncbi:Protein F18A1.6 b, partial [Aphelenchoides avenae]